MTRLRFRVEIEFSEKTRDGGLPLWERVTYLPTAEALINAADTFAVRAADPNRIHLHLCPHGVKPEPCTECGATLNPKDTP